MGSGFDEMSLRSHPALHAEHLAQGVLTAEHLTHRGWLAAALRAGGYEGIPTEWWHFDHGDRDAVRQQLPRVF
jgi:zinc D-Ala-D-Ala dipeptidase